MSNSNFRNVNYSYLRLKTRQSKLHSQIVHDKIVHDRQQNQDNEMPNKKSMLESWGCNSVVRVLEQSPRFDPHYYIKLSHGGTIP